MRGTRRTPFGTFKVPPGNKDICPGCGSVTTRTEADRARKMISGAAIEDLKDQLRAAKLRIEALELELNAAKRSSRTKLTGD